MSEGEPSGVWSGTTTKMTIDRPDGTTVEIRRDDQGRVTTTRRKKDGVTETTFVAEFDPDGSVSVLISEAGQEPVAVEPESVESHSNPYGAMVERLTFPGLVVENVFDDDGSLRSVSMRGAWGEQTMEVRADGGRMLRWDTSFHNGNQTWDASGRLVQYEVSSFDETSYRRDVVDDVIRHIIDGWNGHSVVNEVPGRQPGTA